jgi:hypothetical protein
VLLLEAGVPVCEVFVLLLQVLAFLLLLLLLLLQALLHVLLLLFLLLLRKDVTVLLLKGLAAVPKSSSLLKHCLVHVRAYTCVSVWVILGVWVDRYV